MNYIASGTAVTKSAVAVSRRACDKLASESKEEIAWFNVIAWERPAETRNQSLHQGSKVYL